VLRPVRCLLVDPAVAADVVSPAYDSLSPAGREAYVAEHPMSWLGAVRSPEDRGRSPDDPDTLAASRAALERLLAAGAFAPRPPALYVYRLTEDGHTQTAVVGELALDGAGSVRLLGHEEVWPPRVESLRSNLEWVGATSSPIATTWRAGHEIDEALAAVTATRPQLAFESPGGPAQQVWAVTDATVQRHLTDAMAAGVLYIVDGHHRAAATRAFLAGHAARSEADRHLLVAAFPDHHLRVAAFHRLVETGAVPASLEGSVAVPEPSVERGSTAITDPSRRWWRLALPGDPSVLDVERLHRHVLAGQLGMDDHDPRIAYVPGDGGLHALQDRAVAERAVGFALAPVPVAEVLARADAGRTMPAKTTYFHPKVRSGVFLRLHDPADHALVVP
jgi:uncharacterized protein (DUF1015 family)